MVTHHDKSSTLMSPLSVILGDMGRFGNAALEEDFC